MVVCGAARTWMAETSPAMTRYAFGGDGDAKAFAEAAAFGSGSCRSVDLDPGAAASVALDQRVERCRIGRMQPHAAMRGRSAETAEVIGAVNGKAVIEKDRVRHRRIVVLLREPAPRHHLRREHAAR